MIRFGANIGIRFMYDNKYSKKKKMNVCPGRLDVIPSSCVLSLILQHAYRQKKIVVIQNSQCFMFR